MTTTVEPMPAADAGNAAIHPRRRPHLTIRARQGWVGLNVREIWRFRELLFSLTARDVKLRYKQTALGVIWVVLQPLVAAGIFSLIFGKLANLPADNTTGGKAIPLFLFTFTGLVAWNVFFGIITKVAGILVQNSALVSKVYFPRVLLPMAGAMGILVDLAVVMVMLLVLQMMAGVGFTVQYLAAPAILGLVVALALGIGTWAAALCVQYRDVAYILPVFLQFLLFGSPVLYSDRLAEKFGEWAFVAYLNPLWGLLGAWKWSVLSTPFPPMWAFVYAAGMSLCFLFAGVMVFRRMERNFADVI